MPDPLRFSTPVADTHVVSAFWRSWLPVGTALAVLVFYYVDRKLTWDLLFAEGTGLFEILHVLIPLAATIIALRTVLALPQGASAAFYPWLVLLGLGCFYIAGEELSWGQHLFGWATPESWAEINRQQETNLHNTSSWFNHKPRVALNLAVILGSVLIPLALVRGWATELIARLQFVLPGQSCHVLGWLVIFYMLWDSLRKAGYLPHISPRDAEMHELYLYAYLLVYAITLRARIRRHAATA